MWRDSYNKVWGYAELNALTLSDSSDSGLKLRASRVIAT